MLRRFFKAEDGQTLIEYGMVTAIVSVALIGSLVALQSSIGGFFDKIITTVNSVI
jgi:Flp pilus assembly pilin Flp